MAKFILGTGERVFTRSISGTGQKGSMIQTGGLRFRWVPSGGGGIDPGLEGGGGGGSETIKIQYSLNEGGTWIDTGLVDTAAVSGSITETYTVRHIVEIYNAFPISTGWTAKYYDEWDTYTKDIVAGPLGIDGVPVSPPSGWSYLGPVGAMVIAAVASGEYGTDCATTASGSFTGTGCTYYSASLGPTTTTDTNGHGASAEKTSSVSTGSGATLAASVTLTGVATSIANGYPVGGYGASADATHLRPNIPISADVVVKQLENEFVGDLDARIQLHSTATGLEIRSGSWAALLNGVGTITLPNHSALLVLHTGTTADHRLTTGVARLMYREARPDPVDPWAEYNAWSVSDEATAFSIQHGGTETMDDCSSLTPTGDWQATWYGFVKRGLLGDYWDGDLGGDPLNGSVTTTGTEIVARVPDDPGPGTLDPEAERYAFLTRQHSGTGTGMLGWVKLRFKIKCDEPAHPVRLQVDVDNPNFSPSLRPNKWWYFTTGAADTWTTVEIDLSAEHTNNPHSVADYHDYGDPIWGTGCYYGTTSKTIVWSELLWGATYQIKEIEVVEPEGMRAHVIMDNAIEPDEFSAHPGPRAIVVEGDGQHVLDCFVRWADGWTADGALTVINNHRPWSASTTWSSPSLTDGVYDEADILNPYIMPAHMIGGGGEGWHFGDGSLGVLVGLDTDIPIQWRLMSMSWDWADSPTGPFPGVGEMDARSVHPTRNAPWGKVIDENFDPASGVAVNLYNPSTGGSYPETGVTTDSLGAYQANAPNSTYPAALGVQANGVALSSGWQMGLYGRHRAVFLDSSAFVEQVGLAIGPTERTVVARVMDDNKILLDWLNRQAGWITTDSGLTSAGKVSVCQHWTHPDCPLILFYEPTSGTLTRRVSTDEGSTWSVAVTIATGVTDADMAVWVSKTGLEYYWWKDGAAIKQKVLDGAGNTFLATSTIVASGVNVGPRGIEHETTGELLVVYGNTSGTMTRIKSTDGGVTWS